MAPNRPVIAPQLLLALVDVIAGNSADNAVTGIYRSGPQIVRFFMRNGYDDEYGTWSRRPHVEEMLRAIMRGADGKRRLFALLEDAVNPRDFVENEAELEKAVAHLNPQLHFDGLELRWNGERYRLYETAGTTHAVSEAQRVIDALDFEACQREFSRALGTLDRDPAAAVTAASSALESIAKTILERLGEPLPTDQTIEPLIKAVMKRLPLLPDESADDQDVRRVLSGVANIVNGIGTLRTKFGTAHGRGAKHAEADRALAELCVNSASAAALFLLHRYHDEVKRE